MSSWLELQEWLDTHAVNTYPWPEWLTELQNVLPMPVYDVTYVLDTCAVYDMAVHAAHWSPEKYVQPVHTTRAMWAHVHALGLHSRQQCMYMVRALYSHLCKYITGVPRVVPPVTDHIALTEAVPCGHMSALARGTYTPLPAKHLSAWLMNAIVHGSRNRLRLSNTYHSRQSSGRRRRMVHSTSHLNRAMAEDVLENTHVAFQAIVALSPRFAPHFSATIVSIGSGKITLDLFSSPPALSDV